MDCNLKDSNGNTPLSLALVVGFKEVIPKLLQGGADLNVRNSEGLTLLHQAIVNKDSATSIFLLHNGADINSMLVLRKKFLEGKFDLFWKCQIIFFNFLKDKR